MMKWILILLSSTALAAPPKDLFELRCKAELTNGAGFKILPVSAFSKTLESELKVVIPVGDYTLKGSVQIMGKNNFVTRPHLVMDFYKGDPIRNNLFHATVAGFTKSIRQEVVELSGQEFLDFEYEKTKYSRVDYTCELRWSKGQ